MQGGTTCPLAKGHSCDIPDFLKLVPEGKSCSRQGICMRTFIPTLRSYVARGIGIVACVGIKNPTKDDLAIIRAAIKNAL